MPKQTKPSEHTEDPTTLNMTAVEEDIAASGIRPGGPIVLTPEQYERFVEHILNPPPPSPEMEKAFEDHRRLFGPL